MSNKTKEIATDSRLFNKNLLATAVAAAVVGATTTTAFATGGLNGFYLGNNASSTETSNATIYSGNITVSGNTITNNAPIGDSNATTDYLLGANTTLTFASNNTIHYGNIDAFTVDHASEAGFKLPNVIVAGNLTMLGKVGSGNSTGNWTINTGNTLTIASNASSNTFNTSNISIEQHGTLNFGNATNGYNRWGGDTLTMGANITMGDNSTINVGNGTTINGHIIGASSGQGTINILGNFTSVNSIGQIDTSTDASSYKLEQINISSGNTYTIGSLGNATATRMNINGTVTAFGTSNITAAVTMGSGSILNLTNSGSGGKSAAARVTGAIDGYAGATGTLNINGTWTTAGVIGATRAVAAINLDNNATTTAHTYTFAHNVNATTINLGHSGTSKNATLAIVAGGTTAGVNIDIVGNIVGSSNSSSTDNAAGGRFYVQGNATVSGNIGTSSARLGDIRIEDGATLTILGADRNIYANNITLMDVLEAGQTNATLAFNGTGTTNVYGVIAGGSTGEGTIDINTGSVTFNSSVGSASGYVDNINVASGANMTTSSNIYVNGSIVVIGKLDVDATGGITITSNDDVSNGFGLQIGDGNANTNVVLETKGTITLKSSTITSASGGATAAFNNATIKLNGTHSSHATSATAYIDIGTNNQTVIIQGNTTIDLDLHKP